MQHSLRPTASFAKPDSRALERREMERRREAALKDLHEVDMQLHAHDCATSMSRSASQRRQSSQGSSFNNMQRSISTSHATAVPRMIPRPHLCIPRVGQTAWSVPEGNSQHISMSPEDYLKRETNDYQRSSSFTRPRTFTGGSQLISPASSYQNDNSQSSSYLTTLTTPSSSFYSPGDFNLSQQSCDSQGGYMSRHSSVSGQLSGMDMLRVKSNASYPYSNVDSSMFPFHMDDEQTDAQSQAVSDGLSDRAGMSLLGLGTGTGAHTLRGSDDILLGVGAATAQFEMSISQPAVSVSMQRTDSQQSTSSNDSNASTLSARERKEAERRQRHLKNQKKIASKGDVDSTYRGRSSFDSREKQAIPKMPCKRKEQQKLTCSLCTEYPDGFHGAHELRRHIERAHTARRKVWICQTPSTPGPREDLPQRPLHTCKQCKSQKHYNVYYNAAAHIRRAHFNPRKLGRCARGEKREVRAGKAGGDKPSIDWLKSNGWIKEIEIEGPALSATGASLYGESTMPDEELDLGILDEEADEPGFQFNDLPYSFIGTGLPDNNMLGIETTLDNDLFFTDTIFE